MMPEDYSKVKNETYYTSPPYKYRPSLAEYLTTGEVTKKGFITDIMHLDFKKNIKILEFSPLFMRIKILKKENLNASENLIIDYLESLKTNNEIKFFPFHIPFLIMWKFKILVKIKSAERFSGNLIRVKRDNKIDYNQYVRSLIVKRVIIGIFLNIIGILSMIFLFIGISKMLKQPKNIRYFFKNFLIKYFRISIAYIFFFMFMMFILASVLTTKSPMIIITGILIIVPVWLFFFYKLSSIASDYLEWIFESKEAEENRKDWLEFKKFVIDHTEIENQPFAHYILWGPFYYYILAVGGIEHPRIR